MKFRRGFVCAALAFTSFAPPAFAVDGCAVLLCLVKGGSGFEECKPILKEFYRDTALGKPPPKCKKQSGGDNSGSARSEEQYEQATTGANAVASGDPNANPYGEAGADQYASAQASATTAVATATEAVNAGVRTADTGDTLTSEKGTQATSDASTATTSANETISAATASCTDAECTVTAKLDDIDPEIAAEAQSELDAEATAAL